MEDITLYHLEVDKITEYKYSDYFDINDKKEILSVIEEFCSNRKYSTLREKLEDAFLNNLYQETFDNDEGWTVVLNKKELLELQETLNNFIRKEITTNES